MDYDIIDSPVFGETIVLKIHTHDYIKLRTMIELYPLNAFSILNKELNKRGFMSTIDVLPDEFK